MQEKANWTAFNSTQPAFASRSCQIASSYPLLAASSPGVERSKIHSVEPPHSSTVLGTLGKAHVAQGKHVGHVITRSSPLKPYMKPLPPGIVRGIKSSSGARPFGRS